MRMDKPSHADIVNLWPSDAVLLTDLDDADIKSNAVRQWRDRNSIPPKYWTRLIAAAHQRDLPLSLLQLADWSAIRDVQLLK